MSIRITIIGTGYVGLVSGACFAELGHDVICVDLDKAKIDGLLVGRMPIYEAGLEDLVQRNAAAGRLRFSTDLPASVKGRDAVFIAVGTPSSPDRKADLSYVYAAAKQVAGSLDQFAVVVTKSTVPVGTNRAVAEIVAAHTPPGVSAAIASNPEFLREGAAISDFMNPDRIVVGVEDPRADAVMRQIYEPLVAAGAPLLITTVETAEIVKYAANAFLAVKLSFINEIADLCEPAGADVASVARGIGMDRRLGDAFLQVGPGWGGSCFPKDTRALGATANELGIRLRVVEACIEANSQRKQSMTDRILAACDGSLVNKRVAVLGLTFKGQTDDMRESPSLDVVPALIALGAEVVAYDPSILTTGPRLLPNIAIAASPQRAVDDADALVVMTDWREFNDYDLTELADLMADPVMIDLRNIFDGPTALRSGFRRYESLGRPSIENAEHRAAILSTFASAQALTAVAS
jgi:UDPglucose 6-dehydrogenase